MEDFDAKGGPKAPPEKIARRKRAGAKAQKWGALFENLFAATCRRSRLVATRMPDGCKQVGAWRLIRVKTPFDWIVSHGGRSAFLDTKTIAGKAFGFSSIEEHQVTPMADHEAAGAVAGYVVWFRELDEVCFYAASHLLACRYTKGSLTPTHPAAVRLGKVGPSTGGLDLLRIFGQLPGMPF